jgi:hypothetical protein
MCVEPESAALRNMVAAGSEVIVSSLTKLETEVQLKADLTLTHNRPGTSTLCEAEPR